MTDHRLHFAATARNRDPILEVLRRVLPLRGTVLEVASGSGEHVVHFARALQQLDWVPSDIDPKHRRSIVAWTEHLGTSNVAAPLELDVTGKWPETHADAVFCANMIHIVPWECTPALLRGAATLLSPGQPLIVYGPFKLDGQHTAPSNVQFDRMLRGRNPAFGVRDLADVQREAHAVGFGDAERFEMPANNQTVVFRKQ